MRMIDWCVLIPKCTLHLIDNCEYFCFLFVCFVLSDKFSSNMKFNVFVNSTPLLKKVFQMSCMLIIILYFSLFMMIDHNKSHLLRIMNWITYRVHTCNIRWKMDNVYRNDEYKRKVRKLERRNLSKIIIIKQTGGDCRYRLKSVIFWSSNNFLFYLNCVFFNTFYEFAFLNLVSCRHSFIFLLTR